MRRVGAAVLAAMMMLFLSACNADSGSDGVATLDEEAAAASDGEEQEKSADEQALEFVECMREHGVDMPDPEVDEDGGARFRAGPDGMDDVDPEAVEKAMEECEELRPAGGRAASPEDRAEMEEKMLALAECMREEGVDMPDPDFSKGGGGFRIGGDDADLDMSDPEVQDALEACSDEVGMPGPGDRRGGGDE